MAELAQEERLFDLNSFTASNGGTAGVQNGSLTLPATSEERWSCSPTKTLLDTFSSICYNGHLLLQWLTAVCGAPGEDVCTS